MIEEIKDWLIIIKSSLLDPIDSFISKHRICCPNCYKMWYQFKKYKPGQITLCKDCKRR